MSRYVESTDVKFKSLDELRQNSTETNGDVTTTVTVKTGLATPKIVFIVLSVAVIGVIAAVGLGVGIANLQKTEDPKPTKAPQKLVIDGQWSYWDPWSECTVTCGGGTQTRMRLCDDPSPQNGGKVCIGERKENRMCSEWSCPDCRRACPSGGVLSSDCQVCECSASTLFGQVITLTNAPLEEVGVYLDDRPYKPIATTNINGRYSVSNLCIDSAEIIFKRERFLSNATTPIKVNTTHWEGNVQLMHLEKPYFTIEPETKVRFVGQNVTLCCKADGLPRPKLYKWFKDGSVIPAKSRNGSIHFPTLSLDHSGSYQCRVETDAGVTISDESILTVVEMSSDSCRSSPQQKLETLPDGCSHFDGKKRNKIVNIGQCSGKTCIKSDLKPNGSCDEYWPSHRCGDKEVTVVNITCDDDFSYPLSVVKSCNCIQQSDVATITGRIYGIQNGVEYPFKRGEVLINGDVITYTSASGFFSFVVPKNKKSIAVNFMKDASRKLMDTVKVLNLPQGVSTTINVIAPVKPPPRPFSSNIGLDIPLGDENGQPPVSTLSIPADSVIDDNGNKYNGTVNAIVHSLDPRNMDDFAMMGGELTTVDEEGRNLPLETFGMSTLYLEDGSGRPLHLNGDLVSTMDPNVFNITSDKNGNPDVNSWYLDPTTGKWVDLGKYKYTTKSNGRRRLLSQMIEARTSSKSIPQIIQRETRQRSVRRVQYRYVPTNCDRTVYVWRPFYFLDRENFEVVKTGSCFVRVAAYTDLNFVTPQSGVKITAVTQEISGQRFMGKDEVITDSDGLACLKIFCNQRIYLFAEKTFTYYAAEKHPLPSGYLYENIANGTQIKFKAKNPYDGGSYAKDQISPIFEFRNQKSCNRKSFSATAFQFAPLVKEHNLLPATGPGTADNTDNLVLNSWYTKGKKDPSRRVCFIKVKIESEINALTATGHSKMKFRDNAYYGSYTAPVFWDETTSNRREKGACIEFRCPGPVYEGKKMVENEVNTLVNVMITSGSGISCNVSKVATDLTRVQPVRNGFLFEASAKDNYGSKFGVFVKNYEADTMRPMCATGLDTTALRNIMKPNINPAVTMT